MPFAASNAAGATRDPEDDVSIVGIDLGTTNTVVGAVKDGHATTLRDERGDYLIPSVVSFQPDRHTHDMYSLYDPVHGLKVGAHHAGQEADPNVPGEPAPELIERITAWTNETYRLADPAPVEAQTCMYTTTADETFILERRDRLVVGSPCSGHGFKFAPAIGERLADLATEAA